MTEALKTESLAQLRHDFLTPVNHIIGYAELLMEDAGERRLEPFVPVFQRVQKGGRALLESIKTNLSEPAGDEDHSDSEAFKTKLQAVTTDLSRTVTSLVDELESAHRKTLADLQAISAAFQRLLDLSQMADTAQVGKQGNSADAHEGRSGRETADPSNGNRGRILIADDDPANRNLLRRRLESEGHEVVEASNGQEAFDLLKESDYDLVLLDILMPEMDGYQTLERMKSDARLSELPVMMISALDEMESVERCIEMGAEAYLLKPFHLQQLRTRIGSSLQQKRQRDRERESAGER